MTIHNDAAVLSGLKLRSILAVLALRADREVRRDELIEELDLTRTTGDAINAVHAHVARLRRWLHRHGGKGVLETVNSGYRLNLDRGAVDAHRFVDLVEQAFELAPSTPSVVATMLEDALSLWRGDALLDALEGPVVAGAADELHQWRAAARETLMGAWLSLDENQKIVLNARRFIAGDPLNESIRARHIVALQRMGRHAEAVEAYRNAEQVLREELDIEPGGELRAASGSAPDAGSRLLIPSTGRPRPRVALRMAS
ncbi:BTAD domain-containing putative transcriptional regulator [Streptomyces sp. NPDC059176]|uniref:AfsR/SARP family transcriptional regulator n=1 Tax=unclassified Streptomyces TaxID=2593676 RepID=UPI0036C0EC38